MVEIVNNRTEVKIKKDKGIKNEFNENFQTAIRRDMVQYCNDIYKILNIKYDNRHGKTRKVVQTTRTQKVSNFKLLCCRMPGDKQ